MKINTTILLLPLIAIFCSFFSGIPLKALSQNSLSAQADSTRSILIINSYHPETKWSEKIAIQLKSELAQQFPGIHIYSGNLNIEEAKTRGTTLLSLRAIIWQMAEQEGDTINPQNQNLSSLYRIKKLPNVIVCIGEEAYFQHLSLHTWQGPWTNIPIVCCGWNDSIAVRPWGPGNHIQLSQLQKTTDSKIKQMIYKPENAKTQHSFEKSMASIGFPLTDKTVRTLQGDTIFVSEFHTTGVISPIPVRENLELLKQLIPKLKEIVWIDNHYYKSAYALHQLRQVLPQLLPEVKLSIIRHNQLNTDSIFDVMLQPIKDRAFVTYAWNINGVYSRHPETFIDSLFSHQLISPILTLTERNINQNYWLGGVYIPTETIIKPTIEQITQILNGTPVDSIPYVTVSSTRPHLNVSALKHFGLEKRSQSVEDAIYENIPPTFYQQYEKHILISIILLIILSGAAILLIRHWIYTKKIRKEYNNYHKVYKRLKTIYQNSSTNFALYDSQGKRLTKIIHGKEKNNSSSLDDLFPQDLFQHPYLKNNHSLQNNQVINEELEIPAHKPSGTKEKSKWNLMIKPLINTPEQKARYMAIAIDLTLLFRERRAKERAEYTFRFATETAGVGVASYNLLTRKGFASSTWYQNLNEKPAQDLYPDYLHVCEEDRKILLAFQQRLYQEHITTPFIRTIQVKNTQGEIHYVQEYIFVREFAPERQTIIVVELNLNYDEPKRKANDLQQAKERAELSNLETEQFLANISHEVRTPLNAIVGFSSILANSTDEEEIRSIAPIIEQNNQLLTTLIDNILYLSKLDSGTLVFNYTEVNPETLFTSFTHQVHEQLQQKAIHPEIQIPSPSEPIRIAEHQFRLVMNNLISNAIKFTSQGTITIGYESRDNDYYFFVKDTGCGIHIVDQENIFKRFNKLDLFTQGTGLGLALCRSIVTHQQGQIGVISTPGEGSTFWFTLPRPPHLSN